MKSLPPVPLLTSNGLQPIAGISFAQTLADYGLSPLTSQGIETLQINVGKMCNQTCHHCHVDAGPHRTEIMTLETMDTILAVLRRHPHGRWHLKKRLPVSLRAGVAKPRSFSI